MTKQKGNELKDLIVKQVLNGNSIYSVAKQFELNKDTVSRWVTRFQETGSAQRIHRPKIAYKVTEDHVQFAKAYIQNNPTVFLKYLMSVIKLNFNDFDITEQWLGKIIKDNNITRKQVRKYHSPYYRYGKLIDKSEQKSRFYDQVKLYPLNHIICLDETAV